VRLRSAGLSGTVAVDEPAPKFGSAGLDLAFAAALSGAPPGVYHGSLSLLGAVRSERGAYGAELAAEALKIPCVLAEPRRPGSRRARTLAEAVAGGTDERATASLWPTPEALALSFADVTHPVAQRALLVAAATDRNLLFIARSGSGATLAARRFLSLLPDLELHELEDAHRVWDAVGLPFTGQRPFRAPHHTVSSEGLAGGKRRPGEVTIARHGLLFLDEVPDIMREAWALMETALEREPLVRVIGVAAPCSCGGHPCVCVPQEIARHLKRLEGRARLFPLIAPLARDLPACAPITDGPKRVALARSILAESPPCEGVVLTARAIAALDARQSATPSDLAMALPLHVSVVAP